MKIPGIQAMTAREVEQELERLAAAASCDTCGGEMWEEENGELRCERCGRADEDEL